MNTSFETGVNYVQQENYSEAVRYFTRTLAESGEDTLTLYFRSLALFALEDIAPAFTDCARLVQLAPSCPAGRWHRGNWLAQAEQFESALSDLSQALQFHKNDEANNCDLCQLLSLEHIRDEIYALRGKVLVELGKSEQALHDLSQAIYINPQNCEAFATRADANYAVGRYKEAIADCDEYIRRSADDRLSTVLRCRGLSRAIIQDSEAAVFDLAKAIELASPEENVAVLYQYRAESLYNLGRTREAMTDANRAIKFGFSNLDECYFVLGNCYAAQEDYNNSITQFSKAIKLNASARTLFNRANSYMNKGLLSEAIADYSRALEMQPDMLGAFVNRARAYEQAGELYKALEDYDRGLRIDLSNPIIHNLRELLLTRIEPTVCQITNSTSAYQTPQLSSFEEQFCRHVCAALDLEEMLIGAIENRVGKRWRWDVIQSENALIFSDDTLSLFRSRKQLVVPLQIIGSHNKLNNTWLWAWDNPSIEKSCAASSFKLRDIGKDLGIEELYTANLNLVDSGLTVRKLTAISSGLVNQAVFAADTGTLVTYALVEVLLHRPIKVNEELLRRIHRISDKGLSLQVLDPLLTVGSYLEFYGLHYQRTPNSIEWEDTDGHFLDCEVANSRWQIVRGQVER